MINHQTDPSRVQAPETSTPFIRSLQTDHESFLPTFLPTNSLLGSAAEYYFRSESLAEKSEEKSLLFAFDAEFVTCQPPDVSHIAGFVWDPECIEVKGRSSCRARCGTGYVSGAEFSTAQCTPEDDGKVLGWSGGAAGSQPHRASITCPTPGKADANPNFTTILVSNFLSYVCMEPQCVPIICPAPDLGRMDVPGLDWSSPCDTTMKYDQTCTARCGAGYVEAQFTTSPCAVEHQTPSWANGAEPHCIPITCPAPDLGGISGLAWVGECNSTMQDRATCTARCGAGFVEAEFTTSPCLVEHQTPSWANGTQPRCIPITCPAPDLGGILGLDWSEPCDKDMTYDEACTARCGLGYVDASFTTGPCRTESQTPGWSSQPHCVPITCPAPELDHQSTGLSWSSTCPSTMKYKTSCTASCPSGCQIVAVRTAMCLENGTAPTWGTPSGRRPDCVGLAPGPAQLPMCYGEEGSGCGVLNCTVGYPFTSCPCPDPCTSWP